MCVELVMNAAAGTWDGEALVKSKHAETLHQVAIAEMMCSMVVWSNSCTKMLIITSFKGAKSSIHPAKWLEVPDGRLHP